MADERITPFSLPTKTIAAGLTEVRAAPPDAVDHPDLVEIQDQAHAQTADPEVSQQLCLVYRMNRPDGFDLQQQRFPHDDVGDQAAIDRFAFVGDR